MPNVKIVTDSTLDLPQEIINENNITVVPLSITIDGQTYIDGVDISPKEFITKMQQSEELTKS
jgi:fatty acid-binding protein DegV